MCGHHGRHRVRGTPSSKLMQVDDKDTPSTLLPKATASQAERFSCARARGTVLPNEAPREAVTRWHKGARCGRSPGKSSNHLALQLLLGQPGLKPGLPCSVCSEGGAADGRGSRQAQDVWQRRGKSGSTGPSGREGRRKGDHTDSEEKRSG